jgi:Flp pilus assembly protein TadB
MHNKKAASFWIIMAIHIIVFTAIGLFTAKGWSLLILFLSVLAGLLLIFWLLRIYLRRHPEKRFAAFLTKIFS